MNKLYVGFNREVGLPLRGGLLFMYDEVPEAPWARVFDPHKDSFNPLKGITHKKARELAQIFYTLAPQGENTLTVRNGRRALRDALLRANRLDEIESDERIPKDSRDEVLGIVGDVLFSPVVRRVLCHEANFSFKPKWVIAAKIDRAELGEEDALALMLFLMCQYEGQFVIPDFGFCGRDMHAGLVRENRLIAGVDYLDELPDKLRKTVLLIKEKELSGTTVDDAEELAKYERFQRGTNAFNAFVANAIA